MYQSLQQSKPDHVSRVPGVLTRTRPCDVLSTGGAAFVLEPFQTLQALVMR
jgi:hypothetical protein